MHLVSKSIIAREIIFTLIMNSSDISIASEITTAPSTSSSSSSNLSPTYATPKEFTLFHKLLSLMTSLEEYSKRYVSEFMFALCDSDCKSSFLSFFMF